MRNYKQKLLQPEHRKYLPILISSSVSASPIHSNWKSCKDCENFCTAMDKSEIQQKGGKKENHNYSTMTSPDQGFTRNETFFLFTKFSLQWKGNFPSFFFG